MTTPDREPTPGTREYFLRVIMVRRWGTIQVSVEFCVRHEAQ